MSIGPVTLVGIACLISNTDVKIENKNILKNYKNEINQIIDSGICGKSMQNNSKVDIGELPFNINESEITKNKNFEATEYDLHNTYERPTSRMNVVGNW